MLHRLISRRTVVIALAAGLALSAPAHAACPRGTTVDHTEHKVCPANKQRPAITLDRECCKNKQGKIHCQAFKQCPKKSPS